jgi:hypothetical protein
MNCCLMVSAMNMSSHDGRCTGHHHSFKRSEDVGWLHGTPSSLAWIQRRMRASEKNAFERACPLRDCPRGIPHKEIAKRDALPNREGM